MEQELYKLYEIMEQQRKKIDDLNLEIRFSLNNIKLEENISDSNATEDGI